MKLYSCCWCGRLKDKEILDNNKGCCCYKCKDEYIKTDRFKEIEGGLN